jgi:hypothetical protein
MLGALGAGAGSWKIVRSKGGRGWYVDTAAAWVAEPGSRSGSVLRRDLPVGHPYRIELCNLADSNGNVNSGVGWHARKMEVSCDSHDFFFLYVDVHFFFNKVLHGRGMFGREDGLYGAVSFAYQG